MKVTIQGIDEMGEPIDKGTIEWDEDNVQFILNPDNEVMRNFLEEPVFVLENGDLRDVYAQDDPELFMENLPKHYKSYACRASLTN